MDRELLARHIRDLEWAADAGNTFLFAVILGDILDMRLRDGMSAHQVTVLAEALCREHDVPQDVCQRMARAAGLAIRQHQA
jgi:hypothetical protein